MVQIILIINTAEMRGSRDTDEVTCKGDELCVRDWPLAVLLLEESVEGVREGRSQGDKEEDFSQKPKRQLIFRNCTGW